MSLNSWVLWRLPEEFKKRFQWLHYPVRDLAAPFDARQQDSPLAEWFLAMTRGERILLHCAAGLGRTGTVAARLLMLAGQTALTARLNRFALPAQARWNRLRRNEFLRNPS